MSNTLERKNAVIYGAGGALGSGVARALAAAGARVFLTGRHAAPLEAVAAGSGGEILHVTSASSQGSAPMMGATGAADAATEVFMRDLAAEVGPSGVRVVGLWTAGVAGTLTDEKIAAVASPDGPSAADVDAMLAQATALRRTPRVAQVADTATFLASDAAAGITGTNVNVTCGLVLR
jgi:NAD(P)-dependent dehydrogenase (short-subunit alcohol dehydrogenase family)